VSAFSPESLGQESECRAVNWRGTPRGSPGGSLGNGP